MISSIKISCEPGEANQSMTPFHDARVGFTFKYPANWTILRQGYLSSNVTIYPPLDNLTDNYFDNLRIYAVNLHGNKPSLEDTYRAGVRTAVIMSFTLMQLTYTEIYITL
jgi:hypothetical protein